MRKGADPFARAMTGPFTRLSVRYDNVT